MRLIDADALKEWVENWLYKDRYYHNGSVGRTIPITELYDILEQIPIADVTEAQQWIPCTERLPEKDGDYLVTYESGYAEDYGFDLIGIAPFEVDCEGFGIWQERYDPVSLGCLDIDFVDIKVTAWMPLPKPYRGDDHDQG